MSTKPDETLKGLLETAKGARLSPAEEEQAFTLLKETLGEGKKGLEVSLEALTLLPWSLGVKAVAEAWPSLKPTARRQFLAAIVKLESDQGKRMRLSIARGLFTLDQPAALKLILGFCTEMDAAGPKERQHFTNVLIGKTKPWILNLPLAELKPADAASLVKYTLSACQQTPAFTQIWIFGWLSEAGLFAKLSEEQVKAIATAAKRWQPRWQKELKKTVPSLPAPIEEALQAPPPPKPPQAPATPPQARQPSPTQKNRERPAQQEQTQKEPQASDKESQPQPVQAQQRPARDERKPAALQPQSERGPQQRAPMQGGFDLQRSLGDIHSYVSGLKAELQQLKGQMRQREPRRAEVREKEQPTSEELENLRRHNIQLEETAAQLRRDIEELISDHEDRAATLGSSDEVQQFKALLGVKLGKDYFDFEALRRESATEVVRRHLGDLLNHIFEVLKTEGVDFKDQE